MKELLDRFFNYITYDTQAKSDANMLPSSKGQLQMAHLLVSELNELGIDDVTLTETGCVIGVLPETCENIPTLAFVAHMDTSPNFPGVVQSQFISQYLGNDIVLGLRNSILSVDIYPEMKQYINKNLIVGDGKAPLGASSKASIAEILAAITLVQHKGIPHGKIVLIFLPDQTLHEPLSVLNLPDLSIDRVYTLDNTDISSFSIENLNMTKACITIQGRAINNMTRGVLVNALHVSTQLQATILQMDSPESTNYYDGFFHLLKVEGSVEEANLTYLICDFSKEGVKKRRCALMQAASKLNAALPIGCFMHLSFVEVCQNMSELLEHNSEFIDLTAQSMRACDIEPNLLSKRSLLAMNAKFAEKGIPSISLPNGGYNLDSKHEFVVVEEMETVVSIIEKIIQFTAEAELSQNKVPID